MKIALITPAPPGSRKGNRVTALRWARILRSLGHEVRVRQRYAGFPADLMVALHARRSFAAARRFDCEYPDRPLVLAMTGTDLYRDLHRSAQARQAVAMADRLVLLQAAGIEALPAAARGKARVIHQSVIPPRRRLRPLPDCFEVCVMGHLRPVKDPFRTALAARRLPASSRIRITQLGGALSEEMARRAAAERARNPRFQWLGERSHAQALQLLSRARLLALTSEMEGGANVVSEALALSVPVVSSHISGSIGLLGEDYPGYFPTGDTRALAALLRRAETDAAFYRSLQEACARRAWIADPARERQAWAALLEELCSNG